MGATANPLLEHPMCRTPSNDRVASLLALKPLRFLATGLLNTLFGYAIYAALLWAGLNPLLALLLGMLAGCIFNYFSYAGLVFDGHRNNAVFARFGVAYGLIYAANASALYLLTQRWGWNPYLAQALCIPLSVVLSWMLMNHWVYKK